MNKIALSLFFGLSLASFARTPVATGTQDSLSRKEAYALEARAESTQDHKRLGEYYRAQAAHERAEAERHTLEADAYQRNPTGDEQKRPMSYRTASHCRYLAEKHAKAALQFDAKAAAHERLGV